MARFFYTDVITKPDGTPLTGVTITLFEADGVTPLADTVYANDEPDNTTLDAVNGFLNNGDGSFEFFIDTAQTVVAKFSKSGHTFSSLTINVADLILFSDEHEADGDHKPAALQSITGWVNVKEHGALGDGTTNDTTAIQAAIDALDDTPNNPSGGGVVFFPPGNYQITKLQYRNKVQLKGSGINTTVLRQIAGTADVMLESADTSTQFESILIEDLTFSAISNIASNTGGIVLTKTRHSRIHRVQLTNTNNFAIKILPGDAGGDSMGNSIEACVIGNLASGFAIVLEGNAAGTSLPDATNVINTYINSNVGGAFKIDKGGASVGANGCLFLGNNTMGTATVLECDGEKNVFVGNRFEVINTGDLTVTLNAPSKQNRFIANHYSITGPINIVFTDNGAQKSLRVAETDAVGINTNSVTKLDVLQLVQSASNNAIAAYLAGTDANPAFSVRGDGYLKWGAGGASTPDVELFRASADLLRALDELNIIRASTTNLALSAQAAADTQRRFILEASGALFWGPGNAGVDVKLYRNAANQLKTDDLFLAAAGIGVGNSAAATTPGTVTRKIEVFDANGASLGFIPVYDAIT